MGCTQLTEHVKRVLGCGFHETTADGSVTLEPVYCLGQCALSPTIAIDDQVHARVTPQRFDRLLATARAKDSQ